MKNLIHTLLLLGAGVTTAFAVPATPVTARVAKVATADKADSTFKAIDDHAVFAPASNRYTPFTYSVETSSAPVAGVEKSYVGRRIGVAEMLAEFIRPSALMSVDATAKEVFINNRFYKVKDVLRVEVTKDQASYEIATADFVIEQVGEDYVDLSSRQNQSTNRITFNLAPDVTNEAPASHVTGADVRFLGAEDKVYKGDSAVAQDTMEIRSPAKPKVAPKSPAPAPTAPAKPAIPAQAAPVKPPVPALVAVQPPGAKSTAAKLPAPKK